jgi:serine O-acetyltransferase
MIGTGAILLGPIRVGNNVRIGANTFILMRDIPDNTTVAGTPGRIVKMNGQEVSMKLPRSEEGQTEVV